MRARRLSPASVASTALAALGLLGLVASPPARADEKDACVAAHSSGQVSRNDGKLRVARGSFLTCANERCPPLVRRDCTQWHQELTVLQPSVVFEVHDGRDASVTDVKVRVDGELIADSVPAIATEVDPGEHVFRFELRSGEVLEQKMLVKVGEKNLRITVRAKPIAGTLPPPPPPGSEQQEPRSSGLSPLAYVFGGVTVVGLAVFTGLSVAGLSKEHALRSSCAPFCAQSDIDTAKRDYLIGDIGLGVAIVAAAATAYVLLTRKDTRAIGERHFNSARIRFSSVSPK